MQPNRFNFKIFPSVKFFPCDVLSPGYSGLTTLLATQNQFYATILRAPNLNVSNINQIVTYLPPLDFDHCSYTDTGIKEEFQKPKIEEESINLYKKEENSDPDRNYDVHYDQERCSIQIKEILIYILNNFEQLKGRSSLPKNCAYAYNPILLKLFNVIMQRYRSAFKTKDEILKYITRKAFTNIKDIERKESQVDEDLLSETLCKRYFKASVQEIEKLGIHVNNRENFLQILFPYKKNCKNTQRYKVLIKKLCDSVEFYQDYCNFLRSFKDIIQKEKERKINIFVSYICSCIERDKIDNILKYKRIPWLDSWIKLAQMTAQEISIALKVRTSNDNKFEKKKTKKV